jgi:ArsR family transcriptional regulator
MKHPVNLFKALSDETRLRILALLLNETELCVCDLIAALKLPQSTVSRHLAYLRKAELVNDRRCGLWMYYSIARRENDFQIQLIDFLKRNLPRFQIAKADRTCIDKFGNDNRCA